MKTKAEAVLTFLPRFRWFVWGFGLAFAIIESLDSDFSPLPLIFLLLGAFTYISEAATRNSLENTKRFNERMAALERGKATR